MQLRLQGGKGEPYKRMIKMESIQVGMLDIEPCAKEPMEGDALSLFMVPNVPGGPGSSVVIG